MADNEHEIVERQVGKGFEARFDLDDAFSDGEDADYNLEFSSAAIRKHLAENPSWAGNHDGEDDGETEYSSARDHDTSISTFCLDGSSNSYSETRSSSSSPPPLTAEEQPDEQQVPQDFSDITLSEEPNANGHSISHKDTQEEDASAPRDTSPSRDTSYPVVHIDVSRSPPSRVMMSTGPESNGEDHQEDETVHPVSNVSSSYLPPPSHDGPPLPPSPSSPLPKSPTTPIVTSQRRQTYSAGPSAFQKVMSKTRPHFLPPKNRQEDQKHMADWQAMMKQSRAAEEKRRKALQERRSARELKIEQSMYKWEKEILSDWRVVYKNPNLRRLWWNGIPTKLRASMWQQAVGNALALSKDNYRNCFSRATRALSTGSFPAETLQTLEQDILSTLPSLHIFHPETGPLYQDLKDMLCAWVVSRADEGLGYVHGTAKIAGMILLNMKPQQGFIVMRNLLERHCMRSLYGSVAAKDDVEAYYRIFDTLLADCMPKIYFNFKQHQISPGAYLPDWLIPLFLDHLPFEACARLWDILLLEGDSFLFRAALAVLAVLEPRLFFPDRQELLDLLRGENKAALEVAKREGRLLDGAKYDIYGVDEETLWERIDSMEDWWKESTWRRLTQRELPDL
ncbi:rab-GTPase-TBC domain-containing protein [Suillus fuscotomentosus]|uniref:Rab-GTPase-TBC domain-containing protein n=1 Tax=Suillus fuscotomentosus TaxID=1912939 RepID=A0AAD4HRC8_9AGAM|nr:rab-GTPase-TBC domain-containing protein [Suillus fuscotomentosus]KAG1904724.1 rab-GTPase-TBC domain-containing protein [Suillus fuscotomentosus]